MVAPSKDFYQFWCESHNIFLDKNCCCSKSTIFSSTVSTWSTSFNSLKTVGLFLLSLRFFCVLETLIDCGLTVPGTVLGFAGSVFNLVDKAASDLGNKELLWRIWSCIVYPLLGHIIEVIIRSSYIVNFTITVSMPTTFLLSFSAPWRCNLSNRS